MSAVLSTPGASATGIVVVGGGVAGLACAWRLAEAGHPVTVVDPGVPTLRATWAAGGMLAPLGEARGPGPFLALGAGSLALYPEFVDRLEAIAGMSVGLHLNGKLLTAATDPEVEALRRRKDWLVADGHAVRWMNGEDARSLEPALDPSTRAGLLLVGNGRVDNRALLVALECAFEKAGGQRVADYAHRLLIAGGRVRGVETRGGARHHGDRVLLAAGAWSGGIHGLPRPLPVRPVKGQMLAFAAPHRPLERVVTSSRAYLIPRETPDGPVVVVGATSEKAGFDLSVNEAGQDALREGAVSLVPSLDGRQIAERWAGLRPGTPDELPILGPDPEVEGLVYATGHYRNGVLLAPATAEAVSEWMTRRAPAGLEAFAPGRFTTPTG